VPDTLRPRLCQCFFAYISIQRYRCKHMKMFLDEASVPAPADSLRSIWLECTSPSVSFTRGHQ
jgi:hypothetical protein